MKKVLRFISASAITFFLFTSVLTQEKSPDGWVGLSGKAAPDFTALGMDDTEYRLESFKGKVVVINLWGTWCKPCIEEMPELNKLVEKFKDENIVFFGFATDKKPVLESFLKKHTFQYIILPQNKAISSYLPKDPTKPNSTPFVFPTHALIDQKGIVAEHFWGFDKTTIGKLEKGISKLLSNAK